MRVEHKLQQLLVRNVLEDLDDVLLVVGFTPCQEVNHCKHDDENDNDFTGSLWLEECLYAVDTGHNTDH